MMKFDDDETPFLNLLQHKKIGENCEHMRDCISHCCAPAKDSNGKWILDPNNPGDLLK